MTPITGTFSQPITTNLGYPDALASIGFNRGLAYVDAFGTAGSFQRNILIGQSAVTINNPSLWTVAATLGGTVAAQGDSFLLHGGVNAAGAISIQSKQRAILQQGQLNLASLALTFPAFVAPPAGVTIRAGIHDGTNGVFLEWIGPALGLVVMIGGVRTRVEQAAFNGTPFTQDYAVFGLWSFLYISGATQLYYNNVLVHTYFGIIGNTQSLPLWAHVLNTGSVANTPFLIEGWAVQRMGEPRIAPTYVHFSAAGTTLLKSGAGTLRRALVTREGNNASVLTLFDSVVGSGAVIAVIQGKTVGTYEFDCDFQSGLTAVCTDSPDITVVFQ